jgi:hypothetical protein
VGARRVWITHACLLPFYLTVGIDLFTIVNYQTRFASSMIVIVAGNLENAKEFLEADFTRTVGSAALILAAFSLCLVKIRRLRVTVPRSFALLPLLGLALICTAVRQWLTSRWYRLATVKRRCSRHRGALAENSHVIS